MFICSFLSASCTIELYYLQVLDAITGLTALLQALRRYYKSYDAITSLRRYYRSYNAVVTAGWHGSGAAGRDDGESAGRDTGGQSGRLI